MNLILDLHILLWLFREPHRLSATALGAARDPKNNVYLSIVSIWELQIKVSSGKLALPSTVQDFVHTYCSANDIRPLALVESHIWTLASLPYHHRDPFDRLLVAQAISEGWTLVTADSAFARYPAPIIR